jgi:hypothetical protein
MATIRNVKDLAKQATAALLTTTESTNSWPDKWQETGAELPELYDRAFPRAANADFVAVQSMLEVVFGRFDEREQQKFDLFQKMAEAKGWSGKRLEAQIVQFLTDHVYPTWKPADIFAVQSKIKLFPYSWYAEQCREGNAKFIECFQIPGVGLMYKMADGLPVIGFERVTLPLKKS